MEWDTERIWREPRIHQHASDRGYYGSGLDFLKRRWRREKDDSAYTLIETQKYMLRRRKNKNLTLDYFNNASYFDADEKVLPICVDPYQEDVFHEEDIRTVEEQDAARYEMHPEALSPEEEAEHEQMRLDGLKENQKDLAALSARYRVDPSYHDGRLNGYYEYEECEKRTPLHNVLSGAGITLRYGEGILGFIYADFVPSCQRGMRLFEFAHALGKLVHEKSLNRPS